MSIPEVASEVFLINARLEFFIGFYLLSLLKIAFVKNNAWFRAVNETNGSGEREEAFLFTRKRKY